ncbi:MAG TPA: sensor histidine kinase [Sorangium sp.]|nr:sensor histidine kinase [Sorangium sp.]
MVAGAAAEGAPSARPRGGALWLDSWRALLQPRRLLPFGAVVMALVVAEGAAGFGWRGAAVSLGSSIVFWGFAPAWWRRWFGAEEGGARAMAAYVGGCLLVVLAATAGLGAVTAARASVLNDAAGLPVAVVLFMVGGWGLGRDIELAAALAAERDRSAALSHELELARLLAVRRQLDPHFLFNTLNAIAEWCTQDAAVAERATLQLASMLRGMLDGLQHSRWPLSEEVALVEQLWALHRMRDPAALSYVVVGDGDSDWPLPPLLLLPLAENAVTHGVRAGHRGEVTLSLVTTAQQLTITLENPGRYAGPRPGAHGLNAFRKRLAAAFGGRASFAIGPCQGGERTVVTVSLPKEV